MAQMIHEQQVEIAQRVTAKLQAFYDDLGDDERAMCILGVRRLDADEETDTQGFMVNHRVERAETLPEEPGGIHPYRINGPTLYTMITPTYQTSV